MALDGHPFAASGESLLRFDRARAAQTVQGMSCTSCGQTMRDIYFETGGSVICAPCRDSAAARSETLGDHGRVLRAVGYGLLGAAAAAAVYGGVRAATGIDVGLVAILVGFLVGWMVRLGSGGCGGALCQAIAVTLTYLAVAASYLPLAFEQLGHVPSPVLLLLLPVTVARSSIIAAVIVVLALAQAWRMNRRVASVVTGPYRIAAPDQAPV
jgi:hypothetical protein